MIAVLRAMTEQSAASQQDRQVVPFGMVVNATIPGIVQF